MGSNFANGAEGSEFDYHASHIGAVPARHRFNVSFELCCSGATSRRWAPPLVARFGVIPRVN